jgi:hypothetical protein
VVMLWGRIESKEYRRKLKKAGGWCLGGGAGGVGARQRGGSMGTAREESALASWGLGVWTSSAALLPLAPPAGPLCCSRCGSPGAVVPGSPLLLPFAAQSPLLDGAALMGVRCPSPMSRAALQRSARPRLAAEARRARRRSCA